MAEDRLTHAERVRLEALAQSMNRRRFDTLEEHFREAEEIETWLLKASEKLC